MSRAAREISQHEGQDRDAGGHAAARESKFRAGARARPRRDGRRRGVLDLERGVPAREGVPARVDDGGRPPHEAEVLGLETPPVILLEAGARGLVTLQTASRTTTTPVALQNTNPTATSSTLQIPLPASAVASVSARGESANENSQVNARLSRNYFSSQSNSAVSGIGSVR